MTNGLCNDYIVLPRKDSLNIQLVYYASLRCRLTSCCYAETIFETNVVDQPEKVGLRGYPSTLHFKIVVL